MHYDVFSDLFLGLVSAALDSAFFGVRYIACPNRVFLRCRISFYLLSVGDSGDGVLEMTILPNQALADFLRRAEAGEIACRPF